MIMMMTRHVRMVVGMTVRMLIQEDSQTITFDEERKRKEREGITCSVRLPIVGR